MVGPYAGQRDEIFAQWKIDMAELATCANVVMKVGGMTMPYSGYGWEKLPKPPTSSELADELGQWCDYLVQTFGADRCMYESNFPPDNASAPYRTIWNMFKIIAARAGYSEKEKADLFHDTAVRVYRIGEARPEVGVLGKI